jgi:hypothetical protein
MPKEKTNKYNTLNINILSIHIEDGKDTLVTVLPIKERPPRENAHYIYSSEKKYNNL